jgi:mono/diheme cytochrome c family protein
VTAKISVGGAGVATLSICLAVLPPAIGTAAAQASTNGPATTGAVVFGKWCGDCHGRADGPGTRALERRYGNSEPGSLEQRIDLTPEFVEYVARHGLGFMPPFRKTEISDSELKAVADYLSQKQK